MTFELPTLDYSYDALEPHLDSLTMEIHHSKHHAGYTSKLNAAIKGTEHEGRSIEEILNKCAEDAAVRNNGGGYWNHCFFWESMSPADSGNSSPSGKLLASIEAKFGSFDEFKAAFKASAMTRFGSGWAWLCAHSNGDLEVCSSANQDNPLMPGIGCGGTPILGLDVWEHAYYLNYQNRRPDYVNAFFNVINWDAVSNKYQSATS